MHMTDRLTTRRNLLVGMGAASTIALAGCSGGGNGDDDTTTEPGMETTEPGMTTTEPGMTPTPEPAQSRLRVAHMSPNAPNVDVYVDGNAVLENVAFGAVSGYLSVSAGDHDVEITPAGSPDTAVFSGTVTLAADTDYTVAAIGEIGDMADQAFEPLIVEDDNSAPDDGTARLQAVHASPDAPAVDITAAGGDVVLFDGVEYGQSGAVEVDAGTYTVQIRGDTDSNDGDVVAEFEVTLEDGMVYTAFAAGYLTPDDEPGDEPFNLLVATMDGRGPAPDPEPQEGRVRVAHMSPNAPNVDIYVDGNAVLEDVPFGAVSGYLSLPAGDHEVAITAAGDPDTEVFSGTVTVDGDTDYTIAATGEIGDMADQAFEPLIVEDDNSDLDDETARLQAFHVSPDAPAVDITAAGGDVVLFDGVEYGQSGAVEVDAGTYTVEIRGDTDGNDGDVVASYEVTLDGGTVYSAFAAGYLTPDDEPGDEPFNLLLSTVEGRGAAPEPTGEGRVRVAHMSPNAPNVDVYLDGSAVLEDVPFGAVSDYLTVSATEHDVEITAAGDPDTSVFSGPVTVAADTDYTIAAIGEIGEQADQPFEPLVLEDDNSEVGSNQSRLRVVHASPDAPAVDVTAAGGDVVLFDGVPYGGSGYAEVEANDYTVQIRGDTDSNDGDVVADFDVSLNGGTVYTAFAAGYLTPDDEPADESFDLLVAQDASHN